MGNKIIRLGFAALLFLSSAFSYNVSADSSSDYSSSVKVTNWNFIASDGSIVDEDSFIKLDESFGLELDFRLNLDTQTLKSGDTIEIELPDASLVQTLNTDYTTLDNDGVTIGRWKILNNRIHVEFLEAAQGQSLIAATIKTELNALVSKVDVTKLMTLTIGDLVKDVQFANPNPQGTVKTLTGSVSTNTVYTIKYNLANGKNNSSNPTTYVYGVGVSSFKDATRDYYDFDGWYDNSGNQVTKISNTQKGNVELTARWKAKVYSITYDLDNGTNSPNNPANYTYGVGVPSFTNPTRTGYAFVKWVDSSNKTVTTISPTANGNIKLYAKWEAATFNIKYELSGGANSTSNPSTYKYGVGVTSFKSPTRTGYTFVRWEDETGKTVTSIAPSATGDKTLVAIWKGIDYSITYYLDNGTNHASNPSKYTVGIGVPSFGDPTRVGYTFKGWVDEINKPVTSISTTDTGVKKLYAKWEVATFNIIYELDGGTNNASNPATYKYGVGVSSFKDPTRTGYTVKGWVDSSNKAVTNISNKDTGDKTLYAKWEANTYNITYQLDGGTNASTNPATYTYGIGVPSFANPTRTGYVFLGWVDSSNNPITAISTTDTGAKKLYAKWEVATFNIIYELNGGTNNASNPATYKFGIGVSSFKDPTRTGYTFKGWVDSSNKAVTSISNTDTGDKTLYAKWEANTYNITYVLDGGTNSPDNPATYTYGIGVPSLKGATRTGYVFGEWADSSNILITSISPQDTGDKVLFARWIQITYHITYVLDGGSNDPTNPDSYIFGIGVPSFAPATRTGYIFLGWVDNSNNQVTKIDVTDSGSKVLRATWASESYTILYFLYGGFNNPDNPSTYQYGIGVPSFKDPIRLGYTFGGWVDPANNPVTSISTTDTGTKSLRAVWNVETYTILYELNGGQNSSSNPDKYTYGIGVASFKNPTRTGYTFMGWVDESNNPITSISTTASGDKTLTALWKAQEFKITYQLGGGQNSSSNPDKYTYGIGVPSFAPATRLGYTFVRWEDDKGKVVTSISTTTTGNVTLCAVWKVQDYKITYELNGGSNPSSNPSKYTFGVGVTSFKNPTRTGYTFMGWVDGSNKPVTSISKTDTGDKHLIATWKAQEFKITYQLGGGQNSSSNPDKYTYGIGVPSFAPATRLGYTFVRWEDDKGKVVTSISTTTTGNVTLCAVWKVQDYKITYELNGGSNSSSNPSKYTFGVGVTSFKNPTRTGYTFMGWVDGSNKPVTSISKTDTGDKHLIATWKAQEFKITYQLGGGQNSSSNPDKYTYGIGVPSFSPATRLGYTFVRWEDDKGKVVTSISTTTTGNVTLCAVWKVQDYKITYELNGGSNSSSNPSKYTFGVGVTSFSPATRLGYTFMGWVDGSNKPVASITKTDTGDKHLIATWKAQEFKITYQLNGGQNSSSNPDKYTYGIGVASFKNPTRTGYTFMGWVDESNNPITSISMTASGDKTLTALWKAQEFKITYQLGGGQNSSSNPDKYTYGIGVPSFAPATRLGYTFVRWEDDKGKVVTSISTTTTGNVTLCAVWKVQDYKITYELNGGSNSSSNPSKYTFGVGVTSFKNPTRTGYTFMGWVDGSNKPVTSISKTDTGDKHLIATWKAQEFKITYQLSGGQNSSSNPDKYTYGIGVPSFAPATRLGYTFVRWEDDKGKVVTSISTTTTGNVTLCAVWKVQDYKITYELNGGSNSSSNPSKYTFGVGVTSFKNPTRFGYIFLRWVDSSNNTVTSISKTATGDKHLIAIWKAEEYSIKYTLNGGSNHPDNPNKYTFGIGIPLFKDPTRFGYTFTGWVDEHNHPITTIEPEDFGTKKLIATWVANQYDIIYQLEGGQNNPSNPSVYTFGVGVDSFGPATRTGYTFVTWVDSENNPITAISSLDTGNRTLTAVWEVQDYAITYILNGGTNDGQNPARYTFGVGVESFSPATRLGYTFTGWVDQDNNPITSISSSMTGDVTLNATWIAEEYGITYDLVGGANDPSNPSTYIFGVGVESFANPTKFGHTFLGWVDSDDNTITTISTTDTGNKHLIAKWTPNVYDISYILDAPSPMRFMMLFALSATNSPDNPDSYTFGVGVPLFYPASKLGHIFQNWVDGDGNVVTSIAPDYTGEITLYATWVPEVYNIIYNLNGGTNDALNPVTYTYGIGVESFVAPTRVGYTFLGWTTELGDPFDLITTTDMGDMTLVATWKQKGAKVTVYYEDEAGNPLGNPVEFNGEIGDAYTATQMILQGYTLKQIIGTVNGLISAVEQSVRFVYTKTVPTGGPVRPIDPVDPVVPVDPVDPVEPVDPIDPVEPVTPVTPVVPVTPEVKDPTTDTDSEELENTGLSENNTSTLMVIAGGLLMILSAIRRKQKRN